MNLSIHWGYLMENYKIIIFIACFVRHFNDQFIKDDSFFFHLLVFVMILTIHFAIINYYLLLINLCDLNFKKKLPFFIGTKRKIKDKLMIKITIRMFILLTCVYFGNANQKKKLIKQIKINK